MSLGMMLKLMGNEIRTAHDGLAAVEAAEKFRPDMILLDIGLPKLNGYDACRRIREQPWSKGIVIVALTGWGQEEDRRRSARGGLRSPSGQAGRDRRPANAAAGELNTVRRATALASGVMDADAESTITSFVTTNPTKE